MSKQKRSANKQQAKRSADNQQSNRPAERQQSKRSKRMAAYRLSTLVALILAILTGIEYVAAAMEFGATVMFILAIAKAYCVVHYFMHVSRLWSPEGSH